MRTIKMEVELIYDDEMMHGDDKEEVEWFAEMLTRYKNRLWNSEIGDEIGEIKITKFDGVKV